MTRRQGLLPLFLLGGLGALAPGAALAQEVLAQEATVAVCVPNEDASLVHAIAVELGRPVLPCAERDRATITVRVATDGPLSGLHVRVRRADGVHRSARSRLPQDATDPRALGVIVASLVSAVEAAPPLSAAPPPEPATVPAPPTLVEARTSVPAPSEPAVLVGSPSPAPIERSSGLGLGLTFGVGLDARWWDASDTLQRDGEGHALTFGADIRLHDVTGHGGAIGVRWGTFVFGAGPAGRESLHVELRYAYRAPLPEPPLVLQIEVGVAGIFGRYASAAELVEHIGLGPVLVGAALWQVGPFQLGLEAAYTAIFDSAEGTFGHGIELLLRTGFFFEDALHLGGRE